MLLSTSDCSGASRKRDAVFSIKGSLAAICKAEVWKKLLAGEAVGVMEHDPNRWSLFIGGKHIKTYTAPTLRRAISRVYRQHPELCDWVVLPEGAGAETRMGSVPMAEIQAGYPYLLCLEPQVLAGYQEKNVTPEQKAAECRAALEAEFRSLHAAQIVRNVRAIDILGSQIHVYGLKREGRD